jgi:hypothetical protein
LQLLLLLLLLLHFFVVTVQIQTYLPAISLLPSRHIVSESRLSITPNDTNG